MINNFDCFNCSFSRRLPVIIVRTWLYCCNFIFQKCHFKKRIRISSIICTLSYHKNELCSYLKILYSNRRLESLNNRSPNKTFWKIIIVMRRLELFVAICHFENNKNFFLWRQYFFSKGCLTDLKICGMSANFISQQQPNCFIQVMPFALFRNFL